MNLDGGGSSQMAIGSSLINRPEGSTFQRPIPTILALVDADSLPLPPTIYYEKIIDTGDPECSLQGSGWFASANAGYYGSTPAMLNQIGTGLDFAEFTTNLPDSGIYEIFAWWVHSSNRCSNTPIIIEHANGTDTVRVDQTDTGSQWVSIGSYYFSGDGNDRIIISDAGTTGTFVVADAIRIVSYDSTITTSIAQGNPSNEIRGLILRQNFPNPFNPSTIIEFELAQSETVNLQIFNILGELVSQPLNGQRLSSGRHHIEFSDSHLSSGIYIYRLSSDRFWKQKKMVLLR
jgi:hypothetical protein